jgi:hypothetical protein
MARDLVFQGVDVLGQNELKLTYKRLYLKKFFRGKAPDNHIGKGMGGKTRGGEGEGREGGREERERKGRIWEGRERIMDRGRLRHDSWGCDFLVLTKQ